MGLTLFFGAFGLACTAVILATQADSVSPLVALPVVALVASALMPRLGAVAMCAWCCLSSVGLFMAPCAALLVSRARHA